MKSIYCKRQYPKRRKGSACGGNLSRLLLALLLCLMSGTAWAAGEQVADYTAYPPFLPRVVSPNILFLLDYSNSMVRPAYGTCSPISNTSGVTETVRNLDPDNTVSDTGILSNCRTRFSNLSYDYDSSDTYSGYFDTAVPGQKYDYGVSAPNLFTKNSGADGKWGANFLNWLTATQFDVLKKVIIAGDLTPAPETAGGNINLRSVLTDGYTFRKQMNLPASTAAGVSWTSCSSADSPDCTSTAPTATSTSSGWPTLTYNWIPTTSANTGTLQTLTLNYNSWGGEGISQAQTLPFSFTFYGNTYTRMWMSAKGWATFTEPSAVSYGGNYWNQDMPYAAAGYPKNFIAPYWDDLYMDPVLGSAIKTFTVGSSPNRIFVITWENVRHYSSSSNATNAQTFQVLLYEGSNHIVFQYLDVNVALKGGNATFGTGRNATIGVADSSGQIAKKYSYSTGTITTDPVNNLLAIFATPHVSYTITPGNVTQFSPGRPLGITAGNPTPCSGNIGACSSSSRGPYNININAKRQTLGGSSYCPSGFYINKSGSSSTTTLCYDHETEGLLQEFRDGELAGTLGFRLGIMRLNGDATNAEGGKVIKHFNEKDGTQWSSILSDTRGQLPTANTPLAEALYMAQGYFRQDEAYDLGLTSSFSWTNTGTGAACDSASKDPYCFKSAEKKVSCCKSFVLTVSSGNFSTDHKKNIYGDADNTETHTWLNDGWLSTGEASGEEGTLANGGWLDNVAYRSHVGDLRPETELDGWQNLSIYAVNTFGALQTNLSADITASATTISVNSTSGFSSSGKIQIGDETISYTGKTATTFTGCTRGADSTVAASHTSGWKVYQAPIADGAKVLKRAAKYGGFVDTGELPGKHANEYDEGEDDKNRDGDPDTYFEASGGSDLRMKIIDAVTDILKSSASGTTVSVLSTSASGEGAIYQAYFYPARVENRTDERTWPGFLRGFYLDKFQNLRDDSDSSKPAGAGSALVMKKDKIVRMRMDADNNVQVDRFKDSFNGDGDPDDSGEGQATDPATTDMDSIITIWEGGKKLAMRAKSDREIYTWVDTNHNGSMETGDEAFDGSGESLLFTTGNEDTLKPYLCAGNPACLASGDEAEKIVRFTRGEPVSGYRNRCISITDGGGDEAGCSDINTDSQRSWALGDIVYSTPTLVSGPGEKYDQIYGDTDYRRFKTKYAGRRSVIYAGANDGMIHAFNGGVYKTGDHDDTGDVESGWFVPNSDTSVNGFSNGWSSSTGLGDELWAFVAHDNLPHLAWLACNGTDTDPSVCSNSEYTHVYYVDQRPKVTDAKIFSDDPTHPGGWGTVLIMGMRLGGGAIDVDINGDSLISGTEKFRSAYYAFDITDPEQKPKLMWRFSDSGLGFTTSYPAIVRVGPKDTDGKWFMVAGSGPRNDAGRNNRDYGSTSTKLAGKVFVVDLSDGSLDRTFTVEPGPTATNPDIGVFMGDPVTVDANLDFNTDTIYIGSNIGGLVSLPAPEEYRMTAGKVYRIRTKGDVDPGNWDNSVLFDPVPAEAYADPDAGKDMGPLLVSPSISKDQSGNLWVFFGTGKLRSQTDSSNSDQQAFYGIKDGCWEKKDASYDVKVATVKSDNTLGGDGSGTSTTCPVTYSAGNLLNVSDVEVQNTITTSQVSGIGTGGGISFTGNTACTETSTEGCSLLGTTRKANGWFMKLTDPSDPTPSEKVLSRSVVLGGLVMFTTYQPTSEVCNVLGASTLYALYYESGSAYIKPVFPEGGTYSRAGTEYVSKKLTLGQGMPTAVGVAIGESVSGFVQKSTGEIVRVKTQPGLGVRSGTASWREKTGGGGTTGIETLYKHIVK